jgi:hypothetical protein
LHSFQLETTSENVHFLRASRSVSDSPIWSFSSYDVKQMALITFSGYPCSGKSTRVSSLQAGLEQRLHESVYDGPVRKIIVLSDDSLDIPRSAYDGVFKRSLSAVLMFNDLYDRQTAGPRSLHAARSSLLFNAPSRPTPS